jgi:hypothetical protein
VGAEKSNAVLSSTVENMALLWQPFGSSLSTPRDSPSPVCPPRGVPVLATPGSISGAGVHELKAL